MSEVQSVLSWNSIVHEKMDKQTRRVPPPQAGPIQARLCGPREGGGNVFNLLQLSTQQTSYTNNKNKKKVFKKRKNNIFQFQKKIGYSSDSHLFISLMFLKVSPIKIQLYQRLVGIRIQNLSPI